MGKRKQLLRGAKIDAEEVFATCKFVKYRDVQKWEKLKITEPQFS